ncbi:MAG: cytochrome c oxidase subunit 3 [Candidatus Eremiobacteraeota bacterium]|nr:cytochrome c oxidase subunit 3 [Candidatus Eremiobacteraeota bacterium]
MTAKNDIRQSTNVLPVRAHPLVFGVVLFLSSELMFFAGLFAAYFTLRANRAAWPPADVHLNVVESSVGTGLLFLSSAFMILMTRSLDHRQERAARAWTGAAIVAAVSFVVLSIHGYLANTFTISTSAYGSIYYTMTGFHLIHVAAGIGLLCALLIGLRSPALTANRRAGAEAMMYYWHFVFVVWVAIWSTIYFIR